MYIIIFPLNIACLLGGDHKRTKSINLFCMQPTTVFACLRLLLLLLFSSVYTSDWLKCNLCSDLGVRRRRVRNLQCPTCDRDNTAQEPNSAVDGRMWRGSSRRGSQGEIPNKYDDEYYIVLQKFAHKNVRQNATCVFTEIMNERIRLTLNHPPPVPPFATTRYSSSVQSVGRTHNIISQAFKGCCTE